MVSRKNGLGTILDKRKANTKGAKLKKRKRDGKIREREKIKLLEQANKVAGEHIPPLHPPRLIKKFAAPPPIIRRRSHGDNIPGLEVKLFLNRGCVIVQRFYYNA